VQPGSYLFMDGDYGANQVSRLAGKWLRVMDGDYGANQVSRLAGKWLRVAN
jgi:hypothetical protein